MSRETDKPAYKGQCLCGSIKYEIDEIELKMENSHCSICRKFDSSAFATFGKVKNANFHWVQGKQLLKIYLDPNGTKHKFCAICGSSMILESLNGPNEVVEFSLSTLDSYIELKPDLQGNLGTVYQSIFSSC